jgi:hypothetical protein
MIATTGEKATAPVLATSAGGSGQTVSPAAIRERIHAAVWGMLISRLDAIYSFAKMIQWKLPDDPLLLDLDGDGIETTSLAQSRAYFDVDGDGFAERTGWVGADDGILANDNCRSADRSAA